jgi:hypothetical protein
MRFQQICSFTTRYSDAQPFIPTLAAYLPARFDIGTRQIDCSGAQFNGTCNQAQPNGQDTHQIWGHNNTQVPLHERIAALEYRLSKFENIIQRVGEPQDWTLQDHGSNEPPPLSQSQSVSPKRTFISVSSAFGPPDHPQRAHAGGASQELPNLPFPQSRNLPQQAHLRCTPVEDHTYLTNHVAWRNDSIIEE